MTTAILYWYTGRSLAAGMATQTPPTPGMGWRSAHADDLAASLESFGGHLHRAIYVRVCVSPRQRRCEMVVKRSLW